jgi:hypothetical protein
MTDYTSYTDEELFALLKSLPEFESLPLPRSWYDKFNLKMKQPENFREAIESNYVNTCLMNGNYINDTIELQPEPKDYVFPTVKADDVPLEVVTKDLKEQEAVSTQ